MRLEWGRLEARKTLIAPPGTEVTKKERTTGNATRVGRRVCHDSQRRE